MAGQSRRDLFRKSAVAGAGAMAVPGLAGLLAACANGSTGSSSTGGGGSKAKLAVVTHGQGSDPLTELSHELRAEGVA